jgi:hypothetical protein
MPIDFNNNGSIYWADSPQTPSLGIRSKDIDKCISELKRRKLKGIFGTVPYFTEETLDFLYEVPWVEAAQFYDIDLKSVDGLYHLPNLKYLRISGKRPPIDFGKLTTLTLLVLEYHKRDQRLYELTNLQEMHLWRFKADHKSIATGIIPQNIKELGLFWSNVETLNGLPELHNLRRLEIARCRNLASLASLNEKAPNLEWLVIDTCGRLTEGEARRVADNMHTLKHCFAAKKLIVGKPKA